MLIALPYPWLSGRFEALLAMRAALPHALLIHGPAGIGKSALAEAFVAALSTDGAGDKTGDKTRK